LRLLREAFILVGLLTHRAIKPVDLKFDFYIQGVGAVTPLAPNAGQTWDELIRGTEAVRQPLPKGFGGRSYYYSAVPAKFIAAAGRQPRLRRSGEISLLGVTAGLAALADAGIPLEEANRGAVVFAIACGGVVYTRRFYHEVLTEGANVASPLLFPETVYNAPASHLAAILKIDGRDYTLVGDSSVGLSALHFASQLLAIDPALPFCVVVGVEEADWVLADGFATWRMASNRPWFPVFGSRPGTILAESAAAAVLSRAGSLRLAGTSAGLPFFSQKEAPAALAKVVSQMFAGRPPAGILASANGTFADGVEESVLGARFGSVPVYAHKPAIGDSLGASAMLQLVMAKFALEQQKLPPTLHAGDRLQTVTRDVTEIRGSELLITSVGFNQQVNAALVGR
jgi:3-oxoacyl-[acyl-carrier-protein] synthase II